MKIHTIIEQGTDIEATIKEATDRANAWLAEEGGHLVQAVTAQTIIVQEFYCVHVITISYKLPTAANLATMIAGMV